MQRFFRRAPCLAANHPTRKRIVMITHSCNHSTVPSGRYTHFMNASGHRPGTRERILEAGYAVAGESGVAAVTLDAVAEKAGVSKGGLLYHFPTKEALVAGMVDGLCRTFADLADAAAQADPEPEGRSARAYLAASAGELWQSSRWLALVGALMISPGLLDSWRAWVVAGRAADQAENADPVAAAIVRLAADGLWLAGVLGLPAPDQQLHAAVLAELDQMTRRPRPRTEDRDDPW
jgi:AcrR family transcriptional regulator